MDKVERRIDQGYQIHREIGSRGGVSSHYLPPKL